MVTVRLQHSPANNRPNDLI